MATFNGTAGNDIYAGTGDDDSILGLVGDDTLNGAGGEDTIDGGDNDDLITGGDDNDQLNGNTGDDDISGEDGDDAILGSDGTDIVDGGDGTDSFTVDGLLGSDDFLGTSWQGAGTGIVSENTYTDGANAVTTYAPTDTNDLTQDAEGAFDDGAAAESQTNALSLAFGADLGAAITGFEDGTEATFISNGIAGNQDDLATAFIVDGTQEEWVTTTIDLTGDDSFDITINGTTSAAFDFANFVSVDGLVTAINNSAVGGDLVASNDGGELRLVANVQGQDITINRVDGGDATDQLNIAEDIAGVAPDDNLLSIDYDGDTHTYTIGVEATNGVAGSINTLDELVTAINTDFGQTIASNNANELQLDGVADDFANSFSFAGSDLDGADPVSAGTNDAAVAEANDQLDLTIDGHTETFDIGDDTDEVNTIADLATAVNTAFNAHFGTTGVEFMEVSAAAPNYQVTITGLVEDSTTGEVSTAAGNETDGIFGDTLAETGTDGADEDIVINGTTVGQLGSGHFEVNTLAELVAAINGAGISGLTAVDNGTDATLTDTDSDIDVTGQVLGIADADFTAAGNTAVTDLLGNNSNNVSTLTDIETLVGDNGSLDLTSAAEQFLVGASLSVETSPDGGQLLDFDDANSVMSFFGGALTDNSGDAWQIVGLGSDSRDYGDAGVFTTTLSDGSAVEYDPATGELTYTPADDLELLQNGEEHDGGSLDIMMEDGAGNTFIETFTFNVTGDQTINLFDGGNSFTGGDEDEDVNGTDEADTAIGNGGDDSFDGGDGNDTWWAGQTDDGDDSLDGGVGDDTMGGGTGDDTLLGGEGNDELFGGEGEDYMEGNAGDDTIWSGDDDDQILGGAGDDLLGGGLGDDVIGGGDGDDTMYSGSDDGTDNMTGGDGDDLIFGGAGDNDFVDGGDGNDELYNGTGDGDVVIGGDGEDTLWGGAGDDTLLLGTDGFDDLVGFISGNGNDVVDGFELVAGSNGTIGDVVDLTAFSFADTQAVIDAMTDDGTDTTLALEPGQTVTFNGFEVSDFQAATDDWVLV